ncbi:hypothetical protein S7711_10612 [Stachybotrys chartarum IBT 7711]|uniref:Uncharacterized protein n=1 Tax=Stachybotrys chartarum (strain CBS 109288 / IBT 7711) TaxID=1280523 RepID=A0A084AZ04_STACB|nr:hypothetical protein S7711_10612 [Stachybotrys chartarum IBT 7711]KFA54435.1 hypothetical protein S40293_10801 [Stachybotrys chartarum IBT 40293]KFA79829.1 hypothetical protein S40288_10514 [Stachybotrys chartarum IBT 40288]
MASDEKRRSSVATPAPDGRPLFTGSDQLQKFALLCPRPGRISVSGVEARRVHAQAVCATSGMRASDPPANGFIPGPPPIKE